MSDGGQGGGDEPAAEHPHAFRFSVVIPTYRRRDLVVACVEALGRQEGAPPFEAIVVVDGSDDGTAAALQRLRPRFPLMVVEQANAGPAAARNRGVREASGQIVLFLDDDMDADPHLLAEHDRFHRSGYDVVFGDIPHHPASRPGFLSDAMSAWSEGRSRALRERSAEDELTLTDLITGQMSVRRADFATLGGFDTGFTQNVLSANADLDFGHRLAAAGRRIGFNPDAVSRQRYVVTPRRYLRQWREIGQADVRFARKHPERVDDVFPPRRRESRRYRLARGARVPLRWLVLGAAARDVRGPRITGLFYVARNLEYFKGVREAGGIPVSRELRILCYHFITDLAGAPVLEKYGIPPERFRRQLSILRRRFCCIDLREFLAFVEGRADLPARAVLVTFDDCTVDLLDTAAPLLREAGIPAIAFAVTRLLGSTNEWSRKEAPRLRLLDRDGLHRLAESGIAVGSHTQTHRQLPRLDAGDLERELVGSADDLAELGLGRPALIAYPYGEHDAATRAASRDAGYVAGLAVQPGIACREDDRFALPRIEILRDDAGWRFLLKVARAGR